MFVSLNPHFLFLMMMMKPLYPIFSCDEEEDKNLFILSLLDDQDEDENVVP